MRIEHVEVHLYRVKRQRPVRNGLYPYAESGTTLVRVRTSSGVEGFGWAGARPDRIVSCSRLPAHSVSMLWP